MCALQNDRKRCAAWPGLLGGRSAALVRTAHASCVKQGQLQAEGEDSGSTGYTPHLLRPGPQLVGWDFTALGLLAVVKAANLGGTDYEKEVVGWKQPSAKEARTLKEASITTGSFADVAFTVCIPAATPVGHSDACRALVSLVHSMQTCRKLPAQLALLARQAMHDATAGAHRVQQSVRVQP